MFDFIGKHKRIVQGILALITLPFAFFGVDYYFRQGGETPDVATVGGERITQAEFNAAIVEQQDRMRAQLGQNYDPTMFDNPEVRFSVLEQIINRRLLQGVAARESFRVSDGQLQQFIAKVPAFQENGQFSPERYRQLLAAQNMTPLGFEERMRQDLLLAPLNEPVAVGNIVARSSGERYLGLLEQKREVAAATIDPEQFMDAVKIDDGALKTYYDANTSAFQTPELAKIEYLVLTQDALAAQSALDPAEVKTQYDNNLKTYTKAEERDASHILIAVKPDAKPEDKAAARKKAEDVYAQAKANPAKFGELAKQYSQDPGSAAQGGNLGAFGRGNMVKPFDDAVFAMKVGDIIGPVETDFGYHVIKLNAINPAKVRPFDEVKAQIEADLKRQKAAQKFAAAADQFQNLVYEQADSLRGRGQGARAHGADHAVHHPHAGAVAGTGQCEVRAGAVCTGVDPGQAQYRGHRGRPQRADGGPDRRLQAGGRAAVRRGRGGDPPPAHAQGGDGHGAEGRQGKARAARAGQERQGGGRDLRAAGDARAERRRSPDSPGCAHGVSSRSIPPRCRSTRRRRTSAAASRSTA